MEVFDPASTATLSYIASERTVQKTSLRSDALLWCDVAVAADRTGNIFPQFVYCCVPYVVAVIISHVTFREPFPSNASFRWFHDSGCEP
jgi:hypothetical protein